MCASLPHPIPPLPLPFNLPFLLPIINTLVPSPVPGDAHHTLIHPEISAHQHISLSLFEASYVLFKLKNLSVSLFLSPPFTSTLLSSLLHVVHALPHYSSHVFGEAHSLGINTLSFRFLYCLGSHPKPPSGPPCYS